MTEVRSPGSKDGIVEVDIKESQGTTGTLTLIAPLGAPPWLIKSNETRDCVPRNIPRCNRTGSAASCATGGATVKLTGIRNSAPSAERTMSVNAPLAAELRDVSITK